MIIIDGVSLAEKLEPVFRIGLSLLLGFTVYLMLKMINSIVTDNKKRDRLKETKQLYTARKRQFEGDEKGWKKWRDTNYKITDLVEANYYF